MILVRKEITINQGTAPYTYQWINNVSGCVGSFDLESGTTNSLIETDITFTNEDCVNNADIELIIVDSNGCTGRFPIDVENPCNVVSITGFSTQIVDSTFIVTVIANAGNFTFDWNYNDLIFDRIGIIDPTSPTITLELLEDRPIVTSTSISVTITEVSSGCKGTFTYVYTFCTPIAQNKTINICQVDNAGGTARFCLDATPCSGDIDWSTLQIYLPPLYFVYVVSPIDPSCIVITASPSTPIGNYVGTWTVKDAQGNLSSTGTLNMIFDTCGGGSSSCISAPDITLFPPCANTSGPYPQDLVLVDLDDIVNTNNCEVDWDSFYFIAGTGQSASGTGVTALLTVPFGTVAFNANHEVVFTITSAPSGSMIVQWSMAAVNGDETGIVNIAVNLDCLSGPMLTKDVYTESYEGPYPFYDVLANDSGNINPSTVFISTAPTEGTININGSGEIQYVPGPLTVGIISYVYQVYDYNGQISDTGNVDVTVIAAGNDTTYVNCGPNTLTPRDLLADPKTLSGTWAALTGGSPPAPGTPGGTVDFTGIPDGTYVFEYTVTSGAIVVTGLLTIEHTLDCCAGVTYPVTLYGESLSNVGTAGVVRLAYDLGTGNGDWTGTISFENLTLTQTDVATLDGINSTGEILVNYDYTPGAWQNHIVQATLAITTPEGCSCTSVINLPSIPSTLNLEVDITGNITCT